MTVAAEQALAADCTRRCWQGAIAVCAMVTLTACAKAIPTNAGKLSCLAFSPITWSVLDTDTTIGEIKQHNAAWDAYCK